MSEYNVGTALSLEDLFLSQEFGKPGNGNAAAVEAPTLFGSGPASGPLVPLSATAAFGAVLGHDTLTHQRRNRALAAVSGLAAALLVAVGVAAQTHGPSHSGNFALGHGNGSGGNTSTGSGKTGGGTTTPTTPPAPNPTTTPTPVGTVGTAGSGTHSATLADFGSSSANHVSTATGHTTVPTVVSTKPATTSGTKPTGTTPAPTPASGGALSPVTSLLGHAVTTVGNTAITAATGLTVTLPPVSPVTNAVGSVGGALSVLGDMLSGTTV